MVKRIIVQKGNKKLVVQPTMIPAGYKKVGEYVDPKEKDSETAGDPDDSTTGTIAADKDADRAE
ncbi:hypothetical protein [Sporolactobacillus terrae]|uniref:hypothetical protein n=1 Tax=Sporolactobacillus terrae TaxID=269673 RepID=UPI00048F0941|nr:hypothetical protein [Sporolactobacillus terrae]